MQHHGLHLMQQLPHRGDGLGTGSMPQRPRFSADLKALKAAVEEGLSYQTLVTSVLHKYVTGQLEEVKWPRRPREAE